MTANDDDATAYHVGNLRMVCRIHDWKARVEPAGGAILDSCAGGPRTGRPGVVGIAEAVAVSSGHRPPISDLGSLTSTLHLPPSTSPGLANAYEARVRKMADGTI